MKSGSGGNSKMEYGIWGDVFSKQCYCKDTHTSVERQGSKESPSPGLAGHADTVLILSCRAGFAQSAELMRRRQDASAGLGPTKLGCARLAS